MGSGAMAARFSFSHFLQDRGGNFGIITAILAPLAIGVGGIAIDLTHAVQIKTELQALTDSATLAGASSMSNKGYTTAQAKELAQKFLASQLANFLKSGQETDAEMAAAMKAYKDGSTTVVTETPNGKKGKIFDIQMSASYAMPLNPMTRMIIGQPTIQLSASSTAKSATESKNALSMYLVLDQSGSMDYDTDTVNAEQPTKCYYYNGRCYEIKNYVKKIDALKAAVNSLVDTIKKADPDVEYARLGAVSYNDKMQNPEKLDWGTDKVKTYVSKLPATGSTNSGEAMVKAYDSLVASSENEAHMKKNEQVPTKFIVFMTDGENNISGADSKTKAACAAAKAAKIEVYSVAFMAPTAGQKLLRDCATDTKHYYAAEDAVSLVAAFQAIGAEASAKETRLTN